MTIEMIVAGIIVVFIIAFIIHSKKEDKITAPVKEHTPEEIAEFTKDFLSDGEIEEVEEELIPTLDEVVEPNISLNDMTRAELIAEAKRRGVKVSTRLSKPNLLKKLK